MPEINIQDIKKIFESYKNDEYAIQMSKYMKYKFEFYGIQKPLRAELGNDFIKNAVKLSEIQIIELVWNLWNEDKREMQHLALDILRKKFKTTKIDINFIEKLIVNKSWWDTVDSLYHHTGLYFKDNMNDLTLWNWVESDNIWLNRSAILFQLKYKSQTNIEVLTTIINSLKHKKEFFIQKAIGWILREYSKTDAKFVINFVEEHNITGLAKREQLEIINKKPIKKMVCNL